MLLPAVVGVAALSTGVSAAVADTWTGASSPSWSDTANWSGGSVPQAGDPLDFLSGCSTVACVDSSEDIGNLTTPELSIADDLPYKLTTTGGALTLTGAVGLDAQPRPGGAAGTAGPTVAIPLTLGDDQTWDVTGPGVLSITDAVGGQHQLWVHLADGGSLALEAEPASVDTAGISVTGGTAGAPPADNGTLILGGSVNAGGGAITVDDAALQLGDSRDAPEGPDSGQGVNDITTGPLAISDGAVTIGGHSSVGPGTTTVDGDLSIDSASRTTIELEGTGNAAGTDYGQLTATGDIHLAGSLALADEGPTSGCQSAAAGNTDTDTLLQTTGGRIYGSFSGSPDGSVMEVPIVCPGEIVEDFPAVIHYTANAVTATFLTPVATTTALSASTTTPAPGAEMTYTATVTPSAADPASPTGTVVFYAGTTALPCRNAGDYTVSQGTATCTLPAGAAGSYAVIAVYSGDGGFGGSTSPAVTITPGGAAAPPTTGGATMAGGGTTTGATTTTTGTRTGGEHGSPATTGGSSGGSSSGSKPSSVASDRVVLVAVHVHGARIRARVRCLNRGTRCVARLQLTRSERVRRHGIVTRRTLVLGSRSIRLGAGRSHTWGLGLNARGRRMLAHHARLHVVVALQRDMGGHQRVVARRTVVLR